MRSWEHNQCITVILNGYNHKNIESLTMPYICETNTGNQLYFNNKQINAINNK